MRVAILVDPMWSETNRAIALTAKIADKHPDAVVLSAGIGQTVYAVERTALRAGLKVAALRCETVEPEKPMATSRDPIVADPSELPPRRPPKVNVMLYELRPDDPDHIDSLWNAEPRRVGTVEGSVAAEARALEVAVETADKVVAFTRRPDWPSDAESIHRIGLD